MQRDLRTHFQLQSRTPGVGHGQQVRVGRPLARHFHFDDAGARHDLDAVVAHPVVRSHHVKADVGKYAFERLVGESVVLETVRGASDPRHVGAAPLAIVRAIVDRANLGHHLRPHGIRADVDRDVGSLGSLQHAVLKSQDLDIRAARPGLIGQQVQPVDPGTKRLASHHGKDNQRRDHGQHHGQVPGEGTEIEHSPQPNVPHVP